MGGHFIYLRSEERENATYKMIRHRSYILFQHVIWCGYYSRAASIIESGDYCG